MSICSLSFLSFFLCLVHLSASIYLLPISSACHYDTLGWIDGFVGATDSAVPCAMMLNLAATMTEPVLAQIENEELTVTMVYFFKIDIRSVCLLLS